MCLPQDLCKALLAMDPKARPGMGPSGAQEVLDFGWFKGFDIDRFTAKELKAPWTPKIKNPLDTSNFDPFDVDDSYNKNYQDKTDWDKDF